MGLQVKLSFGMPTYYMKIPVQVLAVLPSIHLPANVPKKDDGPSTSTHLGDLSGVPGFN